MNYGGSSRLSEWNRIRKITSNLIAVLVVQHKNSDEEPGSDRLNNRARLCSCGSSHNSESSAIAFAQIVAHFTHEFPHSRTMVIARHVRM